MSDREQAWIEKYRAAVTAPPARRRRWYAALHSLTRAVSSLLHLRARVAPPLESKSNQRLAISAQGARRAERVPRAHGSRRGGERAQEQKAS